MIRRLTLAVLFLIVCGARPAVAASCFMFASNVVFGTYTGASTVDVSATLSVICSSGTAYYITLGAGLNGGSVNTRKMIGSNSVLLGYSVFSDAGYTVNWGNTFGTNTVSGTGNGGLQSVTMYAQLPSNEYAPVVGGNYNDTIQAAIVSPTGQFTTSSSNFSVGATGSSACAISANPLAFGAYSGSLVNSSSTITATCTGGTPYNVGLNAGTATGATVTTRSMTGPAGALLGYKLFTNSSHTTNWGNTVGTNTEAGTGTGLAQSLTAYGQIPAGQSANPGAYSDTIIVTLTY
jgi:spore coat protein U-like protein